MPTMLDDRPRPAPERTPEVTVRVVTDSGPATRRRRPTISSMVMTLVAAAVAVAIFLLVGVLTGILHLGNPFATTTIDRSPPALLQKLSNLSRYDAAEGHFQQTIDLEDKVSFLPSFLAGERTVFIAQGTVDAAVDFSTLSNDAVQVRGDHAVTITLPEPKLAHAVVNPATSHVASHDRGLANRVVSLFSDDPNAEQSLYTTAAKKLDAAARESKLVARAEQNTRTMLTSLLGKVGFTDVQLEFAKATPATATHR